MVREIEDNIKNHMKVAVITWVGNEPADLSSNDYDFYLVGSWFECRVEHWPSW